MTARMGRVVVTHPTGNENVRRLLESLVRAQLLAEFRTTIGFDARTAGRSLTYRLLGANAAKRVYRMLQPGQLHQRPARELLRNAVAKAPIDRVRSLADFEGLVNVDWVARGLDEALAERLAGVGLVYGYSGFTHAHVEAARRAGVPAFVEVQHALWRTTTAIAEVERERSPAWAATLPPPASAQKRDLEDRELAAATAAVSPSAQVRDSIADTVPQLPVITAPYGAPAPAAPEARQRRGARPRLLFVGRVVAFKGAADLHALVRELGDRAEVTVIGPVPAVRTPAMDDLMSRVQYLGTMPRREVLAQMAAHDLLVAPSLVEGRSLSVLEAVGQGTPIVVTRGTGADDLATAGAGTVVPIADPEALIAAVDEMISDPAGLESRRDAALEVARGAGWDGFEGPILAGIRDAIGD